ncbi:DUF488 domain-containing protein [Bacillus tianshenii]|nr:DUF488 domain-containing protein [Bacillus tianshenii]
MPQVRVRRIYEEKANADGKRILVDGIWPRGVSKEDAHLDQWMKELAPSSELRKWFGHDQDKFDEFKQKYLDELQEDEKHEKLEELLQMSKEERVTLLYAAKDREHNQAVVLQEWLNNQQ